MLGHLSCDNNVVGSVSPPLAYPTPQPIGQGTRGHGKEEPGGDGRHPALACAYAHAPRSCPAVGVGPIRLQAFL